MIIRVEHNVMRRPAHHRHNGAPSHRGAAYEPENMLSRPHSADRRRLSGVGKDRHWEDEMTYIRPDHTREGRISYEAYDGCETTGTQGSEGAVRRPKDMR
jgi:hypothetical protein